MRGVAAVEGGIKCIYKWFVLKHDNGRIRGLAAGEDGHIWGTTVY